MDFEELVKGIDPKICIKCHTRATVSEHHDYCGPCIDGKPIPQDEDDERNAIFDSVSPVYHE